MKDDLFSTNVEREIGVVEDFFDEELDDMYQWLQYMDGKNKSMKKKKGSEKKRKESIHRHPIHGVYSIEDFMNRNDEIIAVLNGIDVDDDIVENSNLQWKEYRYRYYMNSMIFRKRFSTLFINEMLMYCEKIVEKMFQVETGDFKRPPKKYEKIYVNQMHRITCRFTHSILIDNRNPRDLIPAICTSMYSQKCDHDKYNKILKEGIYSIYNRCKYSLKTRETYAPDDEILYGLIRIAFMLSTGSLDFKGLPKFKELKNFQVESDSCNRVIADLGKAINRKKFEKKTPVYRAFKMALPSIKINNHLTNRSGDFNVGVRALYMTGYLIGSETITEFLEEMVNE